MEDVVNLRAGAVLRRRVDTGVGPIKIWDRIGSALIFAADARGVLSWQVSLDSTILRAYVHAVGA